MNAPIANGTVRVIDGEERVFYDGYWIKAYDPPADTLRAKKQLIEALTRRLFNHVEHGINIPGRRLDEARQAYEAESDPERKRVKGAMLAGALFNRAADIFNKLMELQELGVEIDDDNALMRECGVCLQEALDFGRGVLHRSGEEGIDELWGEPFRAFSIPVDAFYQSRYIKIAQTLRDIDRIGDVIVKTFAGHRLFEGIEELATRFTEAAKIKCETLRTDPAIFDVWADFAVASERLGAFAPRLAGATSAEDLQLAADGLRLIIQGRDLIGYITRARVPMPKSTREYFDACAHYLRRLHERYQPSPSAS